MYTIKYQYWNCTIHYNQHFDTIIMSLICQKRIAVSMVVTENVFSVLALRLRNDLLYIVSSGALNSTHSLSLAFHTAYSSIFHPCVLLPHFPLPHFQSPLSSFIVRYFSTSSSINLYSSSETWQSATAFDMWPWTVLSFAMASTRTTSCFAAFVE